jgi:molybdopterin-guanine dinucleotide biosynthesis protein A
LACKSGPPCPLERRLASNELRLRDAIAELDTAVVEADGAELVNVNRPEDLETIRQLTRG